MLVLDVFLRGLIASLGWGLVLNTLLFCLALYCLPFPRARFARHVVSGIGPPPPLRSAAWSTRLWFVRRLGWVSSLDVVDFLVTLPLYALFLSLYLRAATPSLIRSFGDEPVIEPALSYLSSAWPAAILIIWLAYVPRFVPVIGISLCELEIGMFLAAIPIMVALYTHEGLLRVLSGSFFVVVFHPVIIGALLMVLKTTSILRTRAARTLALHCMVFGKARKDSVDEARIAAGLAPPLFIVPIFVLFVFIYATYFASGVRP